MPPTEDQIQAIRDEEFFRNEVRKEFAAHERSPNFFDRCSTLFETKAGFWLLTTALAGIARRDSPHCSASSIGTASHSAKRPSPRGAIRGCFDPVRKRCAPGAATQFYRVLRGLILFALSKNYMATDPMRCTALHCTADPKPNWPQPVNAADDVELLSSPRTIDASKLWPSSKLAVGFHLLTGARPTEVRLAMWPESDLTPAL